MQTFDYDVVIIGAGASGLMCAATASGMGKRVLLLDHASRTGRRIAISGGGKANVTNRTMAPEYFLSNNLQFTRSALERFQPSSLLQWLHESRISIEEREQGQIFCTRSAEDIVNLLLSACSQCTISLTTAVSSVRHNSEPTPYYSIVTERASIQTPSLVIATGNVAWPQARGSDFGLRIARQFGHAIVQPRPALVGLVMPSDWNFTGLAGISLPVNITVKKAVKKNDSSSGKTIFSKNNKKQTPNKDILASQRLSLLFTHKGISGPATLQASLYWEPGDALIINWLPDIDINAYLQQGTHGKLLVKNFMKQYLPDRLAQKIIPATIMDTRIAELPANQRLILAKNCHEHTVIPEKTEGFRKAEVAKGGISTDAISSKTMESRLAPGLFFCGEVLDVTGRLGGYNLHWAFASGHAVGEYLGSLPE